MEEQICLEAGCRQKPGSSASQTSLPVKGRAPSGLHQSWGGCHIYLLKARKEDRERDRKIKRQNEIGREKRETKKEAQKARRGDYMIDGGREGGGREEGREGEGGKAHALIRLTLSLCY